MGAKADLCMAVLFQVLLDALIQPVPRLTCKVKMLMFGILALQSVSIKSRLAGM